MENKGGYPHPPAYDHIAAPLNTPYPPQTNVHYHVQSQHPQVIVEQPTTIVVSPNVGPDPTMITCPSCRNTVITRMSYEANIRTHLCAGLLCLFGCWPCVCLPYCMDSCQNGNHYCPSCGAFIGTYSAV